MYSTSRQYPIKQSISFSKTTKIQQHESKVKNDTKQNHILQLKDELVKMRNFLNNQLPEVNKLIPLKKNQIKPVSVSLQQVSNEDVIEIVNINRRLFNEKQKLQVQLQRERSKKHQLSRSLKKHQDMLSQLYDNTHRQLNIKKSIKQIDSRQASTQKSIQSKMLIRSDSKRSQKQKERQRQRERSKDSKQQACIWHSRKQGRSRSKTQKFETQTSILQKHEKKDMGCKVTAPCYSSSEQQMISNLKQISSLQNKLHELMRDSQRTQNRTKKLQLRNQMQRIANKLNCLKQSLGNK